MNPAAEVWNKVRSLMGAEMTTTTLNTWFDDAQAIALEEDRFILYSPTRLKRDIIAARYIQPIQNALHELFSANFQVAVLTEGSWTASSERTNRPPSSPALRSTPSSILWWAPPTSWPTPPPGRWPIARGELQPPVHLRQFRPGQDPSTLCHRPRRTRQISRL